ncbi:mersacidin/lichenicidin family type 2 lantibiotic [Microbispora sp. H10836]|uniref:mersacidin/lichenicidin family type 2 lantibiotic n=1 Tax=Microbispora sp. H10836 TaxID=2729106 RepID=UPI0014741D8B|nr:mersacidin/lichenicidin family type 2 lantibiotic [Microbispora sp. H10836]
MQMTDLTKAWKDPAFSATLSADQLSALPANPAGDLVDIADFAVESEVQPIMMSWLPCWVTWSSDTECCAY